MILSVTSQSPTTYDILMPFVILFFALLGLLIIGLRVRTGQRPDVRPLPTFDLLPSELGRAAEAGSALHIGLGTGRIGDYRTIASLAGLQVLEAVADAAVNYGTPPIVTVGDPTILPLAQDILRRASLRQGVPGRYSPTLVRYISSTPSVYALGAADIVSHEKIMGNVLAGSFNEEASMIVMRGEQREMFQASAADRPPALGALYPADTYLAAGEELYAGGARLTEVLRYVVGLSTQDMLRILIVVLIVMRVLGLFEALGIR